MIHRLSRQTLVNIGLAGAMGVFGMSYMARGKIYEVTMQSDTYRTALKTLKSHPGAQHILGQPIIDKGIFRNIEKKQSRCNPYFFDRWNIIYKLTYTPCYSLPSYFSLIN